MTKAIIGLTFLGCLVVWRGGTTTPTAFEYWEKAAACSSPPELVYTGVWGSGRDDVWISGLTTEGETATRTGIFMHWDGATWTRSPTEDLPVDLPPTWGAWDTARDDVWAVADRGTVLHRAHGAWTVSRSGAATDGALLGVWGSRADDVWAVGVGGLITHWNGRTFSPPPSGIADRTLVGVWGSGRDDVWAVGKNGSILRWDGVDWRAWPSGVRQHLFDVWGAGASDVWAVGAAATILHWDGTAWSSSWPPQIDGDLLGVWGSGPRDVWVVGFRGTILHWDSVAWTAVPSGTSETLNEIWGTDAENIWAVGRAGAIVHWDGHGWSARDAP